MYGSSNSTRPMAFPRNKKIISEAECYQGKVAAVNIYEIKKVFYFH